MSPQLLAFACAVLAGAGVYLLYTSAVLGWRGLGASSVGAARRRAARSRLRDYLVQAGLDRVRPVELVAVMVALAGVGAAVGWAVWGGVVAPAAIAAAAATSPLAAARARRQRRIEQAREHWPRMIEEIRLQAVSLGRSIPEALLDVGMRGPEELRPAFRAARREWLMSTDFARTLRVCKRHLADPTADAVCETLLIAHEIGGTDVDRRLRALIDDRVQDLQGRKDARAKQAGARFARLFVLIVPVGMALVGLSIGDGRAAYQTPAAQLLILGAFACIAGCWGWAAHLMRLPVEQRVFVEPEER